METDTLKWLFVVIIAPLLGALGGWLRTAWMQRRAAKGRIKNTLILLCGLPPEMKAVLIDFHQQGTHTLRDDPTDPAIQFLIAAGFLVPTRTGPHHAIDCYLSIKPDIWEVMDDWVSADVVALERVREQFFEAPQPAPEETP
ncbi:hypothetical protein ACTSKR_11390 [Chitinibacteraceae bacterium HSL-7]